MKKTQWLLGLIATGLVLQAQGEIIFNDTFQAADGTAPNIGYELRQTNGIVTSSYGMHTDGGRPENGYRIHDDDSDGESALQLKMYKPLDGPGSTSWTYARTATDFGPYLTEDQYTITVDSQIRNGGGRPDLWDTTFAAGIYWSVGPETTPTGVASLFVISLDGTGGGYEVYSGGTLLHQAETGSSIVWQERFELKLIVTENGASSTVQALVQGINDENPTDLGTYTVDLSQRPARLIYLYGSQTDNGDPDGGGFLKIDTYDLELYSGTELVLSGYEAWSNSYALAEGPAGDDDQDGLSNIYEYGLGGDPTNSADQGNAPEYAVAADGGTNWLYYVYPKMSDTNSGLSYYLELTSDLVFPAWTNAGYEVVETGPEAFATGFDAVTNRISTENLSQFIRLKIDQIQ